MSQDNALGKQVTPDPTMCMLLRNVQWIEDWLFWCQAWQSLKKSMYKRVVLVQFLIIFIDGFGEYKKCFLSIKSRLLCTYFIRLCNEIKMKYNELPCHNTWYKMDMKYFLSSYLIYRFHYERCLWPINFISELRFCVCLDKHIIAMIYFLI